jgi:hypothetical protein
MKLRGQAVKLRFSLRSVTACYCLRPVIRSYRTFALKMFYRSNVTQNAVDTVSLRIK